MLTIFPPLGNEGHMSIKTMERKYNHSVGTRKVKPATEHTNLVVRLLCIYTHNHHYHKIILIVVTSKRASPAWGTQADSHLRLAQKM